MNAGANYLIEYLMKDEINVMIDEWIAATDDSEFKEELEKYKDVYNTEFGVIFNSMADSGLLSSEIQDWTTLLIKKGVFGSGAKNVFMSLGKSKFVAAINKADTVLLANQLLYKYILDVDLDSLYSAITNLLVVDELYREQVEKVQSYMYGGMCVDDYITDLRLAATLSKTECEHYLIFLNNTLTFSEENRAWIKEVCIEYTNYISTIDEDLEKYLSALEDARSRDLFI